MYLELILVWELSLLLSLRLGREVLEICLCAGLVLLLVVLRELFALSPAFSLLVVVLEEGSLALLMMMWLSTKKCHFLTLSVVVLVLLGIVMGCLLLFCLRLESDIIRSVELLGSGSVFCSRDRSRW